MNLLSSLLSAVLLLFTATITQAQITSTKVQKGKVLPTIRPTVVYAKPVQPIVRSGREGYEDREDLIRHNIPRTVPEAPNTTDPVQQKEAGKAINTMTVINQFDGFNLTGVTPADPSGDAGIDRVVTSTNGSSTSGGTRFEVYDKSGAVISASVSFNSLGTQTGPPTDHPHREAPVLRCMINRVRSFLLRLVLIVWAHKQEEAAIR
ncbi:MAG: hypothetical protein K2Q24_16975 [Chitinophagaceae bacterium]|nr:hypothetical protein [Chitinophagaceae bacterium]